MLEVDSFNNAIICASLNVSLKAFNLAINGGKSPTVTRPDLLFAAAYYNQMQPIHVNHKFHLTIKFFIATFKLYCYCQIRCHFHHSNAWYLMHNVQHLDALFATSKSIYAFAIAFLNLNHNQKKFRHLMDVVTQYILLIWGHVARLEWIGSEAMDQIQERPDS